MSCPSSRCTYRGHERQKWMECDCGILLAVRALLLLCCYSRHRNILLQVMTSTILLFGGNPTQVVWCMIDIVTVSHLVLPKKKKTTEAFCKIFKFIWQSICHFNSKACALFLVKTWIISSFIKPLLCIQDTLRESTYYDEK